MSHDDFSKIITPRGAGARSMSSLSPSAVNVSYGRSTHDFSGGSNWFGPLAPMQPMAPPEVAGRAWDFQPGFNLVTEPRANEPITFAMLRSLADSYDPLRLVIDRRKDQMTRLKWTVQPKHEGARSRPKAAALSPAMRATIREVTEFWKEPTFGMPWRQWLRVLLEDHFVIDAPALYCERGHAGQLIGMQPVDGGLIKRVIDPWGRTPRPIPWAGQQFDWNGQAITAESYRAHGFKLINGYLLPPAFQMILKGLAAIDYTTHDLVYAAENLSSHSPYGHSAVERIITTVNIAMRRAASQLEYFREGNQPDAIFALPQLWTPDQIARFQDYWDSLFSGQLGNRRRMKFVVGDGNSYQALKEPPLKNDFDEWLVRIVCFAFSYPPTAFLNLNNRSTAERHDKAAEEEGLQSTKLFVSELINRVIDDEFDDSIEFAWAEEEEVDQQAKSEMLCRYAEAGVLSLNQVRERLGEEPDSDPNANRLMVKTANGYRPIGHGAEIEHINQQKEAIK